jgi:hypothetical protein
MDRAPGFIRVEEDGNLPCSEHGETGFNSQGSDCLGCDKLTTHVIRHEGDGNLLARDARETQFNSGVLD